MKNRKKLKRYHRDFFFPDWSEDSIKQFLADVSNSGALKFSLHCVGKIIEYSFEYGRIMYNYLLKIVRNTPLGFDRVFEFYASSNTIKKACFRYSFDDFPVDLVLIISADGVVITLYVINKGDNHSTLDPGLYERRLSEKMP